MYGIQPRSGKIDLIDIRGNRWYADSDGVQIGVQQVRSTITFGSGYKKMGYKEYTFHENYHDGYCDGMHKFEMIWTDKKMKFFVDEKEIGSIPAHEIENFWRKHEKTFKPRNSPMAPFDELVNYTLFPQNYFQKINYFFQFRFDISVAVGGEGFIETNRENRNRFFKDKTQFWQYRRLWEDTWSQNSSLLIESIKIWAI